MTLLPQMQMEKCPMNFYQGVVFLLLDNSSPLEIIKRFVEITWLWGDDIITSWVGVPPNGTFWIEVQLLSKFDVSSICLTGDIIDLQTGCFVDFREFKIDSYLTDFGQIKIDLTCSYILGAGYSCYSNTF